MSSRPALLAALGLPLIVGVGHAQTDPMAMARTAAANQTGVMEYCQGHGWADQAAVDAQRQAASHVPPGGDVQALAAAEATGKRGLLVSNGKETSLAQMATVSHTTAQALCAKMSDTAKAVASTTPTAPGTGK